MIIPPERFAWFHQLFFLFFSKNFLFSEKKMIVNKVQNKLLEYFLAMLIASLGSLVLSIGFYFLLKSFLPKTFFAVNPDYLFSPDVLPEPDERYAFLFFIIVYLPVVIMSVYLAGKFIKKRIPMIRNYFSFEVFFFSPLLCLGFVILLTPNFISNYALKSSCDWVVFIILLILAGLCSWLYIKWEKIKYLNTLLLVGYFLLVVFACFRYIQSHDLIPNGQDILFVNLQVVLDPITSFINEGGSFNGYTQYGFYAIFIAPIISLFSDRILALTVIMAFLLIFCHLCFFALLYKQTSNMLIAVAGGLTLLFTAGNFSIVPWLTEPYFQYYPIRVIFPAIILLLFVLVEQKQITGKLICLLPVLCGVSVIWNIDTGVCITIAWLFIRLMKLMENNLKEQCGKMKLGVIQALKQFLPELALLFSTMVLLFLLFPKIRNKALSSQGNYYIEGFYMLPMPGPIDLWLFVIAIYIAGGVYFFYNWGKDKKDKYCVFLLAIFGIGIFSYFQGRSHLLVLSSCMYPAILLFFIFLNKFIDFTNGSGLSKNIKKINCFYVFFLFGFVLYIAFMGLKLVYDRYWTLTKNGIIKSKVNLINQTADHQSRVAIISDNSTYLLCLTGKKTYPFMRRTLTILKKSELETMLGEIDKANLETLYVDIHTSHENFTYFFERLNQLLARKYVPVRKDDSGKMVLLKLKKKAR